MAFQNRSTARCKRFTPLTGAHEWHISVSAVGEGSFPEALQSMHDQYRACCAEQGLGAETVVFSRLYFSDIINQKSDVIKSLLFSEIKSGAVSFIEQMPLGDTPIMMFSYHIKPQSGLLDKTVDCGDVNPGHTGAIIHGKHHTMLWTTDIAGTGRQDPAAQTRELFSSLNAGLRRQNMSLRRNVVRTWVFVRDIDNNYSDMVDARKQFFIEHDLTEKTRYIASTGIEGRGGSVGTLVSVDSLAISDLTEDRIVRMEALEHMSPTISYGVTFERGLRVRYEDRSHLYISGTASIDNTGAIMHIGDVVAQTHRTLDNIEALLAPQGASLNDLSHYILYLRNPKQVNLVTKALRDRMPQDLPVIAVQGAVCRPEWLVEIEGWATIKDATTYPPFL